MNYLKPNEIKQPKGHLILPTPETQQRHVFGGTETVEDLIRAEGLVPTIVNPTGDWTSFATDWDFQRIGELANVFADEETDECFVAAPLNAMQTFLNGIGEPLVNQSRRAAALQSGIQRGLGGSLENAFNTFKTIGTFADTDCPSNAPGMTLDQYFAALPANLAQLEDFLSKGYVPHFIPIPQSLMAEAFKYGTTIGVVCGMYQFNTLEEIIRANTNDNHVVAPLAAPTPTANWYPTQDSENTGGPEKFAPIYTFDYIYLVIVEKKTMFIKLAGHSALFSPSPTELGPSGKPAIIPYEDGDVYKLVNETATYNNIKTYATLADLLTDYDFGNWIAAKETWNSQTFINSLSAAGPTAPTSN